MHIKLLHWMNEWEAAVKITAFYKSNYLFSLSIDPLKKLFIVGIGDIVADKSIKRSM